VNAPAKKKTWQFSRLPVVLVLVRDLDRMAAGRQGVDRITLWQASSSVEALQVEFYGAGVVLPVIVGYTVFSYRVFWGKSTALKY
jgi:cytochrome bd-type quinol oxidase subunit 2